MCPLSMRPAAILKKQMTLSAVRFKRSCNAINTALLPERRISERWIVPINMALLQSEEQEHVGLNLLAEMHQVQESQGQEGGLAPALLLSP